MLPFVDAHFHLWDLERLRYPWLSPPHSDEGPNGSVALIAKTYLPADYRADLARWNLVGAVHVEAGANPADALGETVWLEGLAAKEDLPTALVAFADLCDPGIDSLLAAHARHPHVRGIRQILNWHPDPRRSYTARDLSRDPAWERGFSRLARHGLSFDLQCYPAQMPGLAAIFARHPGVPVMINHLGMPVLADADGMAVWREGMLALAALPQVAVKISGMGFVQRDWSPELVSPLILGAIAAFGADRAMFASDVPTDKLFGSTDRHLEVYHAAVAHLPTAQRAALFAGTANRLYRLGLDAVLASGRQ